MWGPGGSAQLDSLELWRALRAGRRWVNQERSTEKRLLIRLRPFMTWRSGTLGTWIALVANPYPLQTRSVSNYPATVSVAKQSWMNAAYGPPLKTYVSHFDPVIGM